MSPVDQIFAAIENNTDFDEQWSHRRQCTRANGEAVFKEIIDPDSKKCEWVFGELIYGRNATERLDHIVERGPLRIIYGIDKTEGYKIDNAHVYYTTKVSDRKVGLDEGTPNGQIDASDSLDIAGLIAANSPEWAANVQEYYRFNISPVNELPANFYFLESIGRSGYESHTIRLGIILYQEPDGKFLVPRNIYTKTNFANNLFYKNIRTRKKFAQAMADGLNELQDNYTAILEQAGRTISGNP